MSVDLPILDRKIESAAHALAAARREVAAGAVAVASPLELHRRVSTRTTWLELGERLADPLARALRDWVYVLTLERVLWSDALRVASLWRERTIVVKNLEPARIGPREVRERLLRERDDARRQLWGDALASGAGGLADATRIFAERRAQASAQL